MLEYNNSFRFHRTAIGEAWGARAPVISSSAYSQKQQQCMQVSLLLEEKERGVSIPRLMCCTSIAAKYGLQNICFLQEVIQTSFPALRFLPSRADTRNDVRRTNASTPVPGHSPAAAEAAGEHKRQLKRM